MPDATTVNTHTDDHVPTQRPSWTCTTCQLISATQSEQRGHMKEQWQYAQGSKPVPKVIANHDSVYNIKRRLANLPSIPRDVHDSQHPKLHTGQRNPRILDKVDATSGEEIDRQHVQSASPLQCLFCNEDFAEDDHGLILTLDHMTDVHGFFIPNRGRIIHLYSFLRYLAAVVKEWHECLYCGAVKCSTHAAQSHMRDKGHCQLNFAKEPELVDFWEHLTFSGGFAPHQLDNDDSMDSQKKEMRLAGGRTIGSGVAVISTPRPSLRSGSIFSNTRSSQSIANNSELDDALRFPSTSSSRQLTRRDEHGLLGISIQRRGALIVAREMAQRSEAAGRRAQDWAKNKGANLQKFDQLDNSKVGKRGKQTHKLLPR